MLIKNELFDVLNDNYLCQCW